MKKNEAKLFLSARPKKAQALILNNICRYMYILLHRQYGKTFSVIKIADSYILDKNIYAPSVGVFASTLKQAKKLYLNNFKRYYKDFSPSFDEETSVLSLQKEEGFGEVNFYGSQFNPDADRGGTHHFLALDEYASFPADYAMSVAAPMADVHKAPMIMTGTALGPNHFMTEFEHAERKMNSGDKDFFALRWTIEDSLKAGEVTKEEVDTIKSRYTGKKDYIFRAEYMLDWYAYLPNRIFVWETKRCKDEDRVGYFPYNPLYPVDTFWDIGVNGTACWFRQSYGGKHFYINFKLETNKAVFPEFVREHINPLKSEYNFRYHVFPNDMYYREWMSKESRFEMARRILTGTVVPAPFSQSNVKELIHNARTKFERCYFNEQQTRRGFQSLELYHLKEGGSKPEKDEASHGADAFILSENLTDFLKLDIGDTQFDPYDIFRKKSRSSKKPWWGS